MTLRMELVLPKLERVVRQQRERLEELRAALGGARRALAKWAEDPSAGDAVIEGAMAGSSQPYALSFEPRLDEARPAPPPAPATVVATDGSSIVPDRFLPIPCFVVNIGRVALPYGVDGEPLLDSYPVVGPSEEAGVGYEGLGGRTIGLLRDVLELEAAAELAAARARHGPVVVLLDGTLIPWDLDSVEVEPRVREVLRERTKSALERLRSLGEHLSLGAYVSASQSSDVANSLRALGAHAGELWSDGALFAGMLAPGDRTALFRARSERTRRAEEYFPEHEVCFFYVRVDDDVARVELPRWAAAEGSLERLHAALISQAEHCGGYPRALQEAHEQAVITARERELFARILESESGQLGMRVLLAGKRRSKRRRAV